MERAGLRGPCLAWALVLLALSLPGIAAAKKCVSVEEFEVLSDKLDDTAIALASCGKRERQLTGELSELKGECEKAKLAAWTAPQDSDGACVSALESCRGDVEVLQGQLVTRLEDCQQTVHQLEEQEQQAAEELLKCKEHAKYLDSMHSSNANALQSCVADLSAVKAAAAAAPESAAACEQEVGQLAEAHQRAEQLAEENELLRARLDQAATKAGSCNAPAGSVVGVKQGMTPRGTRRTEQLQNQMLAETLAEVEKLELENGQLQNRLAAMEQDFAAVSDVKAKLAEAQAHAARLAEELARTQGSLKAAEAQVVDLTQRREELRTRLDTSHASAQACQLKAAACQSESRALAEAEKRLDEKLAREAAVQAELQEVLAAANNRSAACAETLARTSGSLDARGQRLSDLQQERDELRASLTSCQSQAAECQSRAGVLAESKQSLEAAQRDSQDRLKATEAALEAARKERAEVAAEKKEAEAARLAAEGTRRDAESAQKQAEMELRIVKQAKEAEIERLLQVMAKQEEAQRELREAEELRRQAETGWLPLWAKRRWQAAVAMVEAKSSALQQSASEAWNACIAKASAHASAAWGAVEGAWSGKVQPAAAGAYCQVTQAVDKAYTLTLQPLLSSSVHNWPEVEARIRQNMADAAERVRSAAAAAQAQAAVTKAAADAAVMQQLQRVPALQPHASPAVASAVVWSAVAAVVLPVALLLVVSLVKYLHFQLAPARVAVKPPSSSSTWERLEKALGYRWEQHSVIKEAASGGASTSRLAWLGGALLQLLAAESAFEEQPEGASPQALQQAAEALAGPAAVAGRAEAAKLPGLVEAGNGAKSCQLAASTAAELYRACLAAAYIDSGRSLQAARDVFAGPTPANGEANETANGTAE